VVGILVWLWETGEGRGVEVTYTPPPPRNLFNSLQVVMVTVALRFDPSPVR
jgi:hypothetical protein